MTAPAVLTVEQLEELAKLLEGTHLKWLPDYVKRTGGGKAAAAIVEAAPAILETARAYHRLRSAAAFVREHNIAASGRHYADPLDALLEHAVNLGWEQ